MANASIEDQTRLVLENIRAVLAADGLTMDHIVTTTVFLKDLNDFGKMNEVYATFFKSAPPARATVEVARLPSRHENRDFGNRRASVVFACGGSALADDCHVGCDSGPICPKPAFTRPLERYDYFCRMVTRLILNTRGVCRVGADGGGPYSRGMGCRCQKVTLRRFVCAPTERAPIRTRLWPTVQAELGST